MKKKLLVGLLSVMMLTMVALPVLAQQGKLVNTVDKGLNKAATEVGWDQAKELDDIILAILNVIMGFLGLIAIIIILWGGFIWMTAGGNEEKVTKAKQMIISGVIGLAIVIGAYAIASWVVHVLVNVAKAP